MDAHAGDYYTCVCKDDRQFRREKSQIFDGSACVTFNGHMLRALKAEVTHIHGWVVKAKYRMKQEYSKLHSSLHQKMRKQAQARIRGFRSSLVIEYKKSIV